MRLSLNSKLLAITRKGPDAQEFSRLVVSEGGETILLPTIDVVPKDPEVILEFISIMREKKYDYCAFMSRRAVDVLFDLAERVGKVEEIIFALNSAIIIAVGPKTKSSLISHGIEANMMPEEYSSEGLVYLFSKMDNDIVKGKRIIIPRSEKSKEFIRKALSDLGMTVEELFLYDVKTSSTNTIWEDFIALLKQKKVDAIIFTSTSTVQSFFEIMHILSYNAYSLLSSVKAIIAIGPATSEELRKRNIRPFEAKEHTVRGTFELAKILLGGK
ncbi:MAG: uroporphyrinogen-III synthase [Nitrososphaeraceae archaeon]